jgi:hypothetical protein
MIPVRSIPTLAIAVAALAFAAYAQITAARHADLFEGAPSAHHAHTVAIADELGPIHRR